MPLTYAGKVDVEEPASRRREQARKVRPQYSRGELRRVATARQQPEAAYAANWRREFAGLPPADFPLVGSVLDQLGEVAGERQFELGLAALAAGLAG